MNQSSIKLNRLSGPLTVNYMPTEGTVGPRGGEQAAVPGDVMYVGKEPVMQAALEAAGVLGRSGRLVLRASGTSIPNAVAVANIVTEEISGGTAAVKDVLLDTTEAAGIGRMTSTVEIIILPAAQ